MSLFYPNNVLHRCIWCGCSFWRHWPYPALGTFLGITLMLLAGCSSIYEPVVDYALDRTLTTVTDALPAPSSTPPPVGSTTTEYLIWLLTPLAGAAWVLIDRRHFHRKNGTSP